MKILISGAHGLVGRSVLPALGAAGHDVLRLVRGQASSMGELSYDPSRIEPSKEFLRALDQARPDVVIHLAGENIARKRWSEEQKKRIRHSRVNSTRVLVKAFKQIKEPPRRFIVASAVGIYGDGHEEVLTEESPAGNDFLAEVCQEWEVSAREAGAFGAQVIHLRFGVILSGQGGVLGLMLPSFEMGLGARLGSGEQWMSWISLTDVVHAVRWIVENEAMEGPVNMVAPHPVRNEAFAKVLAGLLGRPAFMRAPEFVLKAALGEMAAMLLSSQRAVPQSLAAQGFMFRHPDIVSALKAELGPRVRKPDFALPAEPAPKPPRLTSPVKPGGRAA